MKKIITATIIFSACAFHATASAAYYGITEEPNNIRFEQYTWSGSEIALYRLPTPGVSTFPGGTCTKLNIPSETKEYVSRFIAFYLFAKSNNKQIFYYYDTTTCKIVSFGMD